MIIGWIKTTVDNSFVSGPRLSKLHCHLADGFFRLMTSCSILELFAKKSQSCKIQIEVFGPWNFRRSAPKNVNRFHNKTEHCTPCCKIFGLILPIDPKIQANLHWILTQFALTSLHVGQFGCNQPRNLRGYGLKRRRRRGEKQQQRNIIILTDLPMGAGIENDKPESELSTLSTGNCWSQLVMFSNVLCVKLKC